MTDPIANFDDIRPYHDNEVAAAVQRIIADPEFIRAIVQHRLGSQSKLLNFIAAPMVSWYLRRHWSGFKSVEAVQRYVAVYLNKSLKKTTAGVTFSGLEALDKTKSYLFVSNHRDIAMDPALVNWCLHQQGFDTARIAIGDNLLKKPCATELMKLNKSFIVRRSAKGPREMIKALGQLSAYIAHSLQTGHHIWIAQKEGRAKDGNDATDPAILKMFYINGKQQQIEFTDYMRSLQIVPVCLSYEYDPCDAAKANELYQLATEGNYQKTEFEDIESIIKGIVGYKGRVHVHFGAVLEKNEDLESPESVAAAIDREIYQGYRFYPANYQAAGQTTAESDNGAFMARLHALPAEVQPYLRQMYANPLLNAQKAKTTIAEAKQ
ncbi:MAG TPA: acyltransferase [Rheinheimera sp.]|uniref:1-acyl-sn-glycerol-3-phosphate acyltransferase n=1 Tax=Rheinheimera sp. TaxID=1869214 RepID=UPI000EE8EEBD|nr:1-acyl-sn-glycerol-3-phosphate acyltransferase [Rheinheimera sp.]HCU66105.1 acyltransferase [Rheinheimera sp.]